MLALRNLTRCSIGKFNKTNSIANYSLHHGTSSYDDDGKTKCSILNQESEASLMINSFSQMGFRLNNGMMVIGPMAIFPKTVLSWNVHNFSGINDKSLSLFYLLEPKLDVLVIGTGDQKITTEFSKNIIGFMKRYSINVEVLPTEQACTTFNFLNGEKRIVAGAFIPPTLMSVSEDDYVRHQIDRNRVFQIDE